MAQANPKLLIIGLGVVLILLSVFADAIGLGLEPRFGWKQVGGLLVGLIVVGVGLAWSRLSR